MVGTRCRHIGHRARNVRNSRNDTSRFCFLVPERDRRASQALKERQTTPGRELRVIAKDLCKTIERDAAGKMVHMMHPDITREPRHGGRQFVVGASVDRRRKRALASVAVAALVASVAVGGIEMYASAPANAAAVVTSDLQSQTMPSFANVVERVKPAVVSVKVNIEDASANSGDLSGQMDNLPPQMRAVLQAIWRSGRRRAAAPVTAPRDRPGLRLLHFRGRVYRHQQPCGAIRQDSHRNDERRQGAWTPRSSARIPRRIWPC